MVLTRSQARSPSNARCSARMESLLENGVSNDPEALASATELLAEEIHALRSEQEVFRESVAGLLRNATASMKTLLENGRERVELEVKVQVAEALSKWGQAASQISTTAVQVTHTSHSDMKHNSFETSDDSLKQRLASLNELEAKSLQRLAALEVELRLQSSPTSSPEQESRRTRSPPRLREQEDRFSAASVDQLSRNRRLANPRLPSGSSEALSTSSRVHVLTTSSPTIQSLPVTPNMLSRTLPSQREVRPVVPAMVSLQPWPSQTMAKVQAVPASSPSPGFRPQNPIEMLWPQQTVQRSQSALLTYHKYDIKRMMSL
mmetsp:Transcript_7100/g.12715  ORF Transcript_7100/g.12715 Transcript_7100/m.12715 type:complete len:319 (+) Transcript_7100:93-1049(+)